MYRRCIMKTVLRSEIRELMEACTKYEIYISDYRVAEYFRRERPEVKATGRVASRFKHLRSRKIHKWASKEGAGIKVKAYGFDELGNVVALTADGFTMQYIGC